MPSSITADLDVAKQETTAATSLQPPRGPRETLLPHEVFWRDIQPWLYDKGYQLRPRYRPGWTPAWLAKGESLWGYEDHLFMIVSLLLALTPSCH